MRTMLRSIRRPFRSWFRMMPAEAVFVVMRKVDVGSDTVLRASFSSIGSYSSVEYSEAPGRLNISGFIPAGAADTEFNTAAKEPSCTGIGFADLPVSEARDFSLGKNPRAFAPGGSGRLDLLAKARTGDALAVNCIEGAPAGNAHPSISLKVRSSYMGRQRPHLRQRHLFGEDSAL